MPFRAETIRGYLQGVHQQYLADPAAHDHAEAAGSAPAAIIETRFRYNQDFNSVYAMVPSTHRAAAGADPGDPDGAGDRARKGARLDHQPLRDAGDPASNFCSASSFPTSPWRMVNFAVMLLMALFVFRGPAQGQLPDAGARRAALRHGDDRLRHADLGLHPHPDRRAVRHRHPDCAAGDAVLRHADAGLVACPGSARSSGSSSR